MLCIINKKINIDSFLNPWLFSEVDCGISCSTDEDCFGFKYEETTSTCHFGVIGEEISESPLNEDLYLDSEGKKTRNTQRIGLIRVTHNLPCQDSRVIHHVNGYY